MMATSYWSPDGKPMSANQMVESLFGELPHLFKDEDELRAPMEPAGHAQGTAGRLGREGLRRRAACAKSSRMIDAENSDLFDVLAYIAFALSPITR